MKNHIIGQRNTIKEVTILNNYLQVIFTEKVQTEQQYNEFKKAENYWQQIKELKIQYDLGFDDQIIPL